MYEGIHYPCIPIIRNLNIALYHIVSHKCFCCDQCRAEVPEWGRREIKKNTTRHKLRKSGGQMEHCPRMYKDREHGLCIYLKGVGYIKLKEFLQT